MLGGCCCCGWSEDIILFVFVFVLLECSIVERFEMQGETVCCLAIKVVTFDYMFVGTTYVYMYCIYNIRTVIYMYVMHTLSY